MGYASTAFIARTLSAADWGGFTFIFSLTTLLGAIFDFQASRLVLEELLDPEVDSGRAIGSYMMLRFALGAASYVAAIVFVVAAGYPDVVQRGMLLGGVMLLLSPTWNGLFLYFQAQHWLRSVAVASALSRVLLLAITITLIAVGTHSLVLFIWPSLAAEAFTLVALVVIAQRHIHIRPVIEPRRWLGWLKETVPIVLGAAIGTVYFRLDAIMLSQLDNLTAVGLYGIAYKFSDLLAFVPTAVMAPTFTLLVASWPDNIPAFWRNFRGALVLMTVAAFSLTAAFCAFSRPLIEALYGARYAPASNAARLVMLGQGARFFTILCTFSLIAVRRNVLYAIASIVGLIVNVGLNIYLIPRYSYGGAAFATVTTELGVLVVLVLAIRSIPGALRFPWAMLGRVSLATAAFLVTAVLADDVMPWPLAGGVAGIVLLAVLHVVGIDGPGGLRVLPHLLQPVGDTEPSGPGSLEASGAAPL
jgi:O-antigen/teichoic acid export membrane protein